MCFLEHVCFASNVAKDWVTRPAKPDKTNRKSVVDEPAAPWAQPQKRPQGSTQSGFIDGRLIWVCQIPFSWFVPNCVLQTPARFIIRCHQYPHWSVDKLSYTMVYLISGQTQMCDDQVIFAHLYSCTARIVVVTCCYESYLIIWPFSAWFYWIQWNIQKWPQKWGIERQSMAKRQIHISNGRNMAVFNFSHVVHQKSMDPPQDKKRKDPPAVEEEASKKAKSDAEKECRQMSTASQGSWGFNDENCRKNGLVSHDAGGCLCILNIL